MKISIVVPVYNVEKYIKKCLVSCFHQNLPADEFEVIVVNDGTPDNSMMYVEEIAKQHSNIVIVSQTNAGLSAARNKGMSIARGEYVWFVDSDDWIKNNCLNEIYDICRNEDLDILYIGAIRVKTDNSTRKDFSYDLNSIYSGKDCLSFNKIMPCAQYAIYKRSFLKYNNLSFYVGIYHEDFEFTYRAIYFANRVKFVDEIYYYHFLSPNSIVRSINPKKSFDLIIVCESLSRFSKHVENEYKIFYNNKIALALNNALFNILDMDKKQKNNLNRRLMDCKYLFCHLIHSSIFKYKIEGFLFILIPHNIVNTYHFLQCLNCKKCRY